jgi:hypothetical protein
MSQFAGHVACMSPDELPLLLQRCWVEGGTQPTRAVKPLYDSSLVVQLAACAPGARSSCRRFGQERVSSEWHHIAQSRALAEHWRRLYPSQSWSRYTAARSASAIQGLPGKSISFLVDHPCGSGRHEEKDPASNTCFGEHKAWPENGGSLRAEVLEHSSCYSHISSSFAPQA